MPSTLAPAGWKKLLKEHPDAADAAPLTKALEDYGRAEGKESRAEVEALDRVVARAEAARKKNAKLKPLVAFLDDLIGDAEKERAKASKAAEAEAAEAEEEEEAGAALKASLVRVKKLDPDAARPFVLALGAVAGLVIPKRPPITKDHRNQARAMRTGKGKLLYGKCYGEGGKYIFELEDKPPGGLTKIIKKAAKVHANIEIRLKVRGAGEELDDETDLAELTDFGDEGDEAKAAAPTATPESEAGSAEPAAAVPDQAAAFAARAKAARASLDRLAGLDPGRAAPLKTEFATALGHAQAGRLNQAVGVISSMENRLAAALREAESGGEAEPPEADRVKAQARRVRELLDRVQAINPDRAARLKTAFATALGHAQAGRTGEALKGLREVEALANGLLPSARPEPGRPVAAPPPPSAEATWARRLKDLTPGIKDALQAGGPRAQEVKLKFSEAQVFARKGEFDRAVGLMDEVEVLLSEAGVDPGAGREAFLAASRSARAALERLSAAAPGLASPFRAEYAAALNEGQANRYDEGLALLESIEARLAGALRAAEAAPRSGGEGGVGAEGVSVVSFQAARIEWSAARDEVRGELADLEEDILDLYGDEPNFAELPPKLRKLDSILAGFEGDLVDELDDVLNAAEPDRPRLRARALSTAGRYLAYVRGNAFLKAVATNPITPVPSLATLEGTLAGVVKNLGG